jgi:hypothetical protein
VSVHCGALVATLLGLGRVVVRAGAPVVRGGWLGAAGGAGLVRLGARRGADRHGYLDPLRLLGGAERAPPVLGRRRFGPAPRRPAVVRVPRVVRGWRLARPRGGAARVGVTAWLGAGLLAAALGAGVTRRRSARRVASATPCPSTSPRRSTT